MAQLPVSVRTKKPKLSDWQLFTNNGNFNNPLPPSRRLNRKSTFYSRQMSAVLVRYSARSVQSRNQSAIAASTARILSSRSVTYRRKPRMEPAELDLEEEYDTVGVDLSIAPSSRRVSTTSSQRAPMWAPKTWSFSHLYRAIIVIDEQARKDVKAGRSTHALAAWQNALIYCEQLEQRSSLWPENKTQLDEQIAMLRRAYRLVVEEMKRKHKHFGKHIRFLLPTRECTVCKKEQPVDQFHERFSTNCQHIERTICNKCMYNTARTLLASPGNTDIFCPEPQCDTKFSSKQVQDILTASENSDSDDDHPRRRSAKSALERTTSFIWCAYEGCDSGQFHTMGPSSSPIVVCILCKRRTCALHQVKWHVGLTCLEYDQKQEEENRAASEKRRRENSKHCARCQTLVERISEIDRMQCTKCSYTFCWECLADFKPIEKDGSHRHKNTCRLYAKDASKSSCTIL